MNLREGFKIDEPSVVVPWGVSETELQALIPLAGVGRRGLRKVTRGYYCLSCESLGGLVHELGFHFSPRSEGRLVELEFFRRSYPDQAQSFEEFQAYFERHFGKPSHDGESCGFPSFRWYIGGCEIVHYVFDRFGPEEHMRIRSPRR